MLWKKFDERERKRKKEPKLMKMKTTKAETGITQAKSSSGIAKRVGVGFQFEMCVWIVKYFFFFHVKALHLKNTCKRAVLNGGCGKGFREFRISF